MSGDFGLVGGDDLKRISRLLRETADGKALKRELSKELRKSSKPMVPAVRSSIQAIPTHGKKHSGLRKEMMRATKLSVKTAGKEAGITIRVDGRKMPDGKKTLPAYMEGKKKPWRHPVFGMERWVKQEPHPYFYRAVLPLVPKTRDAVYRALQSITDKIS